MTRDNGSIVLGWLTKLAATLALLGLLSFDGIALVRAGVTAADHANSYASSAADVYKQTHDVQKAYEAALALAVPNGETIKPASFVVDPANGDVTLTVHREAQTLWMYRISALKKYTDMTGSGSGAPAP